MAVLRLLNLTEKVTVQHLSLKMAQLFVPKICYWSETRSRGAGLRRPRAVRTAKPYVISLRSSTAYFFKGAC